MRKMISLIVLLFACFGLFANEFDFLGVKFEDDREAVREKMISYGFEFTDKHDSIDFFYNDVCTPYSKFWVKSATFVFNNENQISSITFGVKVFDLNEFEKSVYVLTLEYNLEPFDEVHEKYSYKTKFEDESISGYAEGIEKNNFVTANVVIQKK